MNSKLVFYCLALLVFICVKSYAGNLEPSYDFDGHEVYAIMQNGERIGYANMGFKDGHVAVSVINTTGNNRQVKVECELNNHGSTTNVAPGSLRMVKGVGLVADKPKIFLVTRDFCGWGAINIIFR
jgi:prepilin-type processing-associated H-X9-DG protein